MTLEQEWFKQEGAPSMPARERPIRPGDVVARGAAYLILLGIFAFSFWALSLVSPYMGLVVTALLFLLVVRLWSSVRELRAAVAELRNEVAALRRPTPPPEAAAPETAPGSP